MSAEARARVVQEALSWLRTPWHHAARVKGAGVDCALLLAEVFERAGVMPRIEPEAYPIDWHLHRDEERYLQTVLQHARPVVAPGPGDIVLWRLGRCYSHGAIVIDWPQVVHAYRPAREVLLEDISRNSDLVRRQPAFFSPWED